MTTSDQINEIAGALAKAQGEMAGAVKDSSNPFFRTKYADLSSVREACIGPLTKNGIAVVQSPSTAGAVVSVVTQLIHSSGQWLRGEVACTAKDDSPQSVGSAITYLRRYALQSFSSVAPEDDDGEAAHGRGTEMPEQSVAKPVEKAQPTAQAALGTTTVAQVIRKAGRSKRGQWLLFIAKFADGREGSTFDKTDGEALEAAAKSGDQVNPQLEQGEKGWQIKSLQPVIADRPLEPVVERGPEEPVDGPEKVLTARKITQADGSVYYVIQTAKRELYTDDAGLAMTAVSARKGGQGVMPTFTVVGGWRGIQRAVNLLSTLVVEAPETQLLADAKAALAEVESAEDVREPGSDDE